MNENQTDIPRWRPTENEQDIPDWNDDLANALIGRVLLVGVTYHEASGDRQEQHYGVVVSTDPVEGVCIQLAGSERGQFWLPPDLRTVQPASPGSYRLRSTGDTVENPDFLAAWTIHPPKH